jgi:trehalose 6-phosphate synthase
MSRRVPVLPAARRWRPDGIRANGFVLPLWLRFILPLLLMISLVAYLTLPLVERLALRWFVRDIDIRSALVANTIHDSLVEKLQSDSRREMLRFFVKITQDERLFAVGYCDRSGALIATPTFPKVVECTALAGFDDPRSRVLPSPLGPLHVSVHPVLDAEQLLGELVLIHDMSFIQRRSEETRKYLFFFFAGLAAVVSLITVVVAQLTWRGWIEGTRTLLRGEGLFRPATRRTAPELRPLAKDLRDLIRDLEFEYRPRDESQLAWTPDTLRAILRRDLRGEDILVVSNREPYIHVHTDLRIEIQRPASGLVTALEPIMRACSGTWIAHGSGDADREVVDRNDRVRVPPAKPAYAIRRLWLSKEEEAGYYYGFSNEGLWPLCHIAHVRPTFRTADWNQYVGVNRRFAETVVEEATSDDPIVLVQDYHFALLPRLVRERLPNATIVTFWHIPWPNPEAFAICPWRQELLDGLLGSSILGFHTQFHCNNFMDTVDRTMESRVDRETMTISYGGKATAVKRYPISIEWPPPEQMFARPVRECREAVRRRHGLPDRHAVGIGVDRLDYTKGIVERLLAVERLMELEPQWIGRYTFVQIAAPSRTSIPSYRNFALEVTELAQRINARYVGGPPPVVLLARHHEPEQVYEYYRAAEACMVTSLHDGMNLVAKEFVAARDDEQGVLILSQFTGAARELPEALIVNPYDIDQCAAALHIALTMSEGEQRDRMRLMRRLVREFNVFRWAGRMLIDAASMRRRGRVLERARARPEASAATA